MLREGVRAVRLVRSESRAETVAAVVLVAVAAGPVAVRLWRERRR